MPSYPDIDKIDTNIRHALGILDLMMDNIGHRVDSDQDSMEFALWSAVKHLKEATNEIERVGDKNLADLLSKVDSDPLGEDEGTFTFDNLVLKDALLDLYAKAFSRGMEEFRENLDRLQKERANETV